MSSTKINSPSGVWSTPIRLAEDIHMSMMDDAITGRFKMMFDFPPVPAIATPANLNHLMNIATEAAIKKLAEAFVEHHMEELVGKLDLDRLAEKIENEIAKSVAKNPESGFSDY